MSYECLPSDREKHYYYYGQCVFCQETDFRKKIINSYSHARLALENWVDVDN